MKTLVPLIVIAALILSVLQHLESVRLSERERDLTAVRTKQAAISHKGTEISSEGAVTSTKMERQEKPTLDLPGYLELYKKSFVEGRETLTQATIDSFELELADASPADLARLPELLAAAGIEEPYDGLLYEVASTRLLERDPALACQFALKGKDILNFHFVIRSWIARDPVAARKWVARRCTEDPPFNEFTLRPHASHMEAIDVAGLQLTAMIAASPAGADLSPLVGEQDTVRLRGAVADLAQTIPSAELPILLKRLSESGRPELVEMVLRHYPEPADAREQLESAGLPPEQFLKAATMLVAGLDATDMQRGVVWFLGKTDPAQRDGSLREIVTAWTRENPRTARAWLESLPPGGDREAAMTAYAEEFRQPKRKPMKDPF